MNALVRKTFENRGYTLDYLKEIDCPDYGMLMDLDKACVRLREIHDAGLAITVYPDFDMDGISSGSELFAGLAELGFAVNLFVPDSTRGYGIGAESAAILLATYPETKVVLTCDVGIGELAAVDYFKSQGIEVIVTDHHKQKADKIVKADITIDPMRVDETYAHPQICGAFVAYQLLQRYADLYCNGFIQDQIRRLRVFAGLGTVSDTMPLLYENRQIVRDAVAIMRMVYGDGSTSAVAAIPGCDIYRRAFYGLYQIAKICEINGRLKTGSDITEDFFGFTIAPMFNSAKRLGSDMSRAFGVFFAGDSDACAKDLYTLNAMRKELVTRKYADVVESDQPYAPYIYFSDAPAGTLGLIAMKLMSETGQPTLVLSTDESSNPLNKYYGSGRSPEWYAFLSRISPYATSDGHECSFGVKVADDDMLKRLYEFMSHDVDEVYSHADIVKVKPDFVIATDGSGDTGIDVCLFMDYLDEIELYRPFGKGFPSPSIAFHFGLGDIISCKQIGKANEHLKVTFRNGFDLLCWYQGARFDDVMKGRCNAVMGRLERSEFRGEVSVCFKGDFV